MKKSLLPLLVVVYALSGTVTAQILTTYDGSYAGQFSGKIECDPGPPTPPVIQTVQSTKFAFTVTVGVVTVPGLGSVRVGTVDNFGNVEFTLTPPGFAYPVTFKGMMTITGFASGKWSIGKLPPECTTNTGGNWSATFRPPVPSSVPPLSVFPPAGSLFPDLYNFLQANGAGFDPSSQAFLLKAAQETKPLIDPSSRSNLQQTAADAAAGLKLGCNIGGLVMAWPDIDNSMIQGGLLTTPIAIMATIGFADLTPEQETAAAWASLAGIVAGAIFVSPAITAVGTTLLLINLNLFVYANGVVPALQMIAGDPADPNYTSVVIPDPVQVPQLPSTGSGPLDTALSKSCRDALLAQSFLGAVNTSFNRYSSATTAGDAISAGLQLEALLDNLARYDQAIQDAAADLKALPALLVAAGFGDHTFGGQALKNFQTSLVANGLPPDVIQALTSFGLTTAQIQAAQTKLLAVDPNTISGTLFGAINNIADAARRASSNPPLTVTSANDSGVGTLRQMILNASPGDTINFGAGISTITLLSGELLIDKDLTINGPGPNMLTVRGIGSRIFDIADSSITATISGLAITRGSVASDQFYAYGGGIYNAGSLTITNCTISGNRVSIGNTGPILSAFGGGIYNRGLMTIANTTISGNSSGYVGGGLDNDGIMTIINSTISGNMAGDQVIRAFGGGSAGSGAGINTSGDSGGLTITNCTISGNSIAIVNGHVGGSGGGISGSFTARANIIALNTAAGGPDVSGTLTSQGFNLIGNNAGATITPAQSSDQIGTADSPIDPLLGPLQDNGGPTQTLALMTGSSAINNGDNTITAPPRDQRNYLRNGVSDIGAFEFGGTIPGSLGNISTRGFVQTVNNVLIGGLIISGGGPKKVILRALGPTLTQFGVNGALADPMLELYDGSGALITTNDNWKDTQQAAISATGKAPPNDLESAILTTLNPGKYTVSVRGVNNSIGVALLEGYDLDDTAGSKFGNISTRGFVETVGNVMIAGVIVNGPDSQNVIIRGLGPTLSQFNVPNVLQDPFLDLHDVNGNRIMTNDNWKDSQQAEIQASGYAPPNDAEAAILTTLAPGHYTAILSGVNGTTGNALVEVYALN